MKMQVKNKSLADKILKFVWWVSDLPGYIAIFFVPFVVLIYIAAVIINRIKGV